MVFFWYHEEDLEPFFSVPDCEEWHDPDYTRPWARHEWTVRTHCQEMQENSVDGAHFSRIHRMDISDALTFSFQDDRMYWRKPG